MRNRPDVDLSIVTFNSARWLAPLFESLAAARTGAGRLSLFVHDNASSDGTAAELARLTSRYRTVFSDVRVTLGKENLGFGKGHNSNLALGTAPWFFVLNPDAEIEPGALAVLAEELATAPERCAAFELRQVPFEHPKHYDPVTLTTSWCSGAAVVFRRSALERVSGFDTRIFLYGEDVDLSWRLRARGATLRYVPRAVVHHKSYEQPSEVKPAQVIGSAVSDLELRIRYGDARDLFVGAARYALALGRRQRFANERRRLLSGLLEVIRDGPHFAAARSELHGVATFVGRDYAVRRAGAFFEVRRPSQRSATPRVSVLIRTTGRLTFLRQALSCAANQTYPNVEVVVVEDGGSSARALIEGEFSRLRCTYVPLARRGGRSAAGNAALAAATGEFLCFLDEDDLLYADHLELLVDLLVRDSRPAAHALAFLLPHDTATSADDWPAAHVQYHQPFSRGLLWLANYLPIQSVVFHRRLYEQHGGFDPALDQFEDWDLWLRYSLTDDFAFAPKVTSAYRVAAREGDERARYARFGDWRQALRQRQAAVRARLDREQLDRLDREIAEAKLNPIHLRATLRRELSRLPFGTFAYSRLRSAFRALRR